MDCYEIVQKYLEDNGFDGLAGDECGCENDDLMCCYSNPRHCVPGYRVYAYYEGEHMILTMSPELIKERVTLWPFVMMGIDIYY